MSATQEQQIAAHLLTTKSLPVSSTWLTNLLNTSLSLQRNVPLSALTQTALFRVLASDFRQSLSTSDPSCLLPVDVGDPNVKERRLAGPIPLQVLDIEDIGSSKWSQVEAIERIERGEAVRGREIIRTVNVSDDNREREETNSAVRHGTRAGRNDADANGDPSGGGLGGGDGAANGPHRLVLQDAAGTQVVAVELKAIGDIAIGKLLIGAKLVLRHATVARGMVLLTPACVTVLGGKIEAMDRAWKQGRKGRLLAKIADRKRDASEEGQ